MKKLIIFYSLDGNTRFIAQKMAEIIEADILELKPEKEIPRIEPFKHFAGSKRVLFKKASKLKQYNVNLADYDTLIIGTPVWAFTFAPAIRAFLNENSIQNKKIILFCTYGSGPGKTFANFENNLAGNEIIGKVGFKKVLKKSKENLKKLKDFLQSIKEEV